MTDRPPESDEPGAAGPAQVEAFDPSPGDLLREARNRRGWTIARVAEDMNLEARFIEAMEDNRFEDLGAPVFARGHLRKYARLLEVDTARLMDVYAEIERERIPPPAASVEGLAMSGDPPPRRGGWRTLLVLVVIVALAALAWRLYAGRQDAAMPSAEPTGQAVPGDSEPGDEALIDEPVAVPLPAIVRRGEGPPPPSEEDEPEEASTEAGPADVPSEDAAPGAETTTPSAQAPADGSVELVLRFVSDSWVEVRDANGNRLVYQLGRTGRQRTVRGTPPFDIFLGFADGVSLELDGEPVSIPPSARLGRTARFRLPADTAAHLSS
jgi:cytoskeleton protein RodZ